MHESVDSVDRGIALRVLALFEARRWWAPTLADRKAADAVERQVQRLQHSPQYTADRRRFARVWALGGISLARPVVG